MGQITDILSERVKQLRNARGMTQENYADFLGITVKTLWQIESGRHSVRFATLEKIIKAENIPVYSLFLDNEKFKIHTNNRLNKSVSALLAKLNNEEMSTVKNLLELIVSKK